MKVSEFNLSDFEYGSETKTNEVRKLPRHKDKEKFLAGPIPLEWLSKAANLRGRALNVSLAIWFLAFIKNSPRVHTSGKLFKILGAERKTTYRALKNLEMAGLIECERRKGCSPIVTILDVPTSHNGNGKESSMKGEPKSHN